MVIPFPANHSSDPEWRKSRLVFVDPDDIKLLYWWPALIVTEDEMEVFRQTMDSDIHSIGPDERLVCYFEDGSFSVVPASAMIPFCPEKEPFVSYARNIRRFTSDLGVSRAVRYYRDGFVPEGFKWLRQSELKPCNIALSGGRGNKDDEVVKEKRQHQDSIEEKSSLKVGKARSASIKDAPKIKEKPKTTPDGQNIAQELESSKKIFLPIPPTIRKFKRLAHLLPSNAVYSRL